MELPRVGDVLWPDEVHVVVQSVDEAIVHGVAGDLKYEIPTELFAKVDLPISRKL